MPDERPCDIVPGDFYEDCSYETMLCIEADPEPDGDTGLTGISLVNGRIGSCSYRHCGVFRLSLREAIEHRGTWPPAEMVERAAEDGRTIPPPAFGIDRDELQLVLERLPPSADQRSDERPIVN